MVFDNMVFGLKFRKLLKKEIVECVRVVVDILEIGYLFKWKLKVFLGGQWQWVVFGWLIVWELKVFLMDELFFNLDVKLCVVMCVEISKFY